MQVAKFPRVRLREFNETRIRRTIKGSLVEEHTDVLLTEPVNKQLQVFLANPESLVLAPVPLHASSPAPSSDDRVIVVNYLVTVADKSEVANLTYGT